MSLAQTEGGMACDGSGRGRGRCEGAGGLRWVRQEKRERGQRARGRRGGGGVGEGVKGGGERRSRAGCWVLGVTQGTGGSLVGRASSAPLDF